MNSAGLPISKVRVSQQARIFMGDLMRELGTLDQHKAVEVLRVVLHSLREILSATQSARLSVHWPDFLQDLYYKGWNPPASRVPARPSKEELVAKVYEAAKRYVATPREAEALTKSSLKFLSSFLSVAESREIRGALPESARDLWPAW